MTGEAYTMTNPNDSSRMQSRIECGSGSSRSSSSSTVTAIYTCHGSAAYMCTRMQNAAHHLPVLGAGGGGMSLSVVRYPGHFDRREATALHAPVQWGSRLPVLSQDPTQS